MLTTTEFPTITLPAVASKLNNGCWVLDAKHRFHDTCIVLGFHSGAGAHQPFATWEMSANRPGHTYSGDYYKTLAEAMAGFKARR